MPLKANKEPEVVLVRGQLCLVSSEQGVPGKQGSGFEGWLETAGSHREAVAPHSPGTSGSYLSSVAAREPA